jgi:hypothetical protein
MAIDGSGSKASHGPRIDPLERKSARMIQILDRLGLPISYSQSTNLPMLTRFLVRDSYRGLERACTEVTRPPAMGSSRPNIRDSSIVHDIFLHLVLVVVFCVKGLQKHEASEWILSCPVACG